MMYRHTTHLRALWVSLPNGGKASYAFRIPVPLGEMVRNLRIWVFIYSRSALCSISVDVNHSGDSQAKTYAAHTVNVVSEAEAGTGITPLTGQIALTPSGTQGALGGMLGSFVEIVLHVEGDTSGAEQGGFDGYVMSEGNPY
ncbi:hypothetical protein L6R50_02765 [Myxococcota bacterium]|nr:hypothetical protein [Myxococcota bacterium]